MLDKLIPIELQLETSLFSATLLSAFFVAILLLVGIKTKDRSSYCWAAGFLGYFFVSIILLIDNHQPIPLIRIYIGNSFEIFAVLMIAFGAVNSFTAKTIRFFLLIFLFLFFTNMLLDLVSSFELRITVNSILFGLLLLIVPWALLIRKTLGEPDIGHHIAAYTTILFAILRLTYPLSILEGKSSPLSWVLGVAIAAVIITGFILIIMTKLIDSLNQSQAELKHLAHRDSLTHLLNRRAFLEEFNIILERIKRFDEKYFLLMIDADHFKKINDVYGHVAGDNALKMIAGYLKNSLRPSDILARFGGEEFIALISSASFVEAETIAERILHNIRSSVVEYENQQIRLTVSIGLTSVEPGNDTWETVRIADMALYQAKENGRDQVVVLGNNT